MLEHLKGGERGGKVISLVWFREGGAGICGRALAGVSDFSAWLNCASRGELIAFSMKIWSCEVWDALVIAQGFGR